MEFSSKEEGISFRGCQLCQGENEKVKNLMGTYNNLTIWNYSM